MSDWSRMGVQIRPDIRARLDRILARMPAAPIAPEPLPRQPPRFNTKLSPARVEALRRLRAEGATLEALARRFHVAISTASRAADGTTWR